MSGIVAETVCAIILACAAAGAIFYWGRYWLVWDRERRKAEAAKNADPDEQIDRLLW